MSYTNEDFLEASSQSILDSDHSLKKGAQEDGYKLVYKDNNGLGIRVVCSKNNIIKVSIYYRRNVQNIAEKWKEISNQLSKCIFKSTKSTIWVNEQRLIASVKEDIQWTIDQITKMKRIIDALTGESNLPDEYLTPDSIETTINNHQQLKKGVGADTDNTTEQLSEQMPIQNPITVKLDLSLVKNIVLEEKQGLCKLRAFGDIQCHYQMLNNEYLCFVFQYQKDSPSGQCIFGIKKDLLQGKDTEVYYQLDDSNGNGHIIDKCGNAIPALPLTYGMTSSWAVGPKTKSGISVKAKEGSYSKILHDWIQYTGFTEGVVADDDNKKTVVINNCSRASMDDFNPSIVLLGQNWSDKIWHVCHKNMQELSDAYWQNFQPGNGINHENDDFVRDAIEGTILEKAYMTDFDKGNIETDGNIARTMSICRKPINESILLNELLDLEHFIHEDIDSSRNIIICVWGIGQWKDIPNEIKYGKDQNWRKYEFRLIGEHYSRRNGRKRKPAVSDFAASITWQQALFNAYIDNYEFKEECKMKLRHLCYICGVIIHNEIYRLPNNQDGFGGVGKKFRDEAVKYLYDETQKQVLSFAGKLPDLSTLTENIKSKITDKLKNCLSEQNPLERGRKAYKVLNGDGILEEVSSFLSTITNIVKDYISQNNEN